MKIYPVRAALFHAEGQTADMTKLRVAFCNFVSALKRAVATTPSVVVQHQGLWLW
jgi:hypothetical protein